jgi:UDP-N-acetylmuramyl pentapeptide phosphotransferase/UDP-N-acetylglucosamine-1-phosphate transferase
MRSGNPLASRAEVNGRSMHAEVMPQGGGLAVIAVMVAVALWTGWSEGWQLFGGPRVVAALVAVAAISWIDDHHHVRASLRFWVHVAAAGLVLSAVLPLAEVRLPYLRAHQVPLWLGIAASLPGLVWFLNLYNFMDGLDGLAGGMTVIGFGAMGAFGLAAGDVEYATSCLVVAGAGLGFLVWNFPPARIFLGDVGACPLGLTAGAMILWGVNRGVFTVWAPMLVFAPFWVDATTTLVRRMIRHEKVWEAHRTHAFQRLAASGWGHRKTTLVEYASMALCAGLAALHEVSGAEGRLVVLLGTLAAAIAGYRWVGRRMSFENAAAATRPAAVEEAVLPAHPPIVRRAFGAEADSPERAEPVADHSEGAEKPAARLSARA